MRTDRNKGESSTYFRCANDNSACKTRFQRLPRGKSRLIGHLCLEIRQLLRTQDLKIAHVFEQLIKIPIKTEKSSFQNKFHLFQNISHHRLSHILPHHYVQVINEVLRLTSVNVCWDRNAQTNFYWPANYGLWSYNHSRTPLSMCSFIGLLTFMQCRYQHTCWTGHMHLWFTSILS